MDQDVPTCSVCLNGYNSTTQRPFDLGCGHSFCEQCIRTSPRSFRVCPECRQRASNPHANIALLRLLDALDGTQSTAAGTGAGTNSQRQQQQQQQAQPQQRPQRHQPTPAFSPGGVFRNTGSSSDHPVGSLGQMLNQVTAAISAAAGSNGNSGSNAQSPVVALPGSLATHKDNIARLRTSMWVYLTPLLGMLYILSPLDIIPDFIPLVGWIDDALVLCYIVCSLYQVFQDRAAPRF